jgi:tetratricopeptide (TPR) repeat protein
VIYMDPRGRLAPLLLTSILAAALAGCDASTTTTWSRTSATLATTAGWSSPDTDATFEVAWGDVDGDGHPDMVTAAYMEPNCLFLNDGALLTEDACTAESARSTSVDLGDWDGDGDMDLAVGNQNAANQVYEYEAGSWNLVWTADESDDPTMSVRWGDWDGDGTPELAVGNMSGVNYIYVNTGGDLEIGWTSDDPNNTRSVAWGDWDNDGDQDLATGNGNNTANHVYLNTGGDLDTSPAWTSTQTHSTYSIDWGDVDGDGHIDLAAGNYHEAVNRLYTNIGGTLDTEGAELSADAFDTKAVRFGDWNGDGDLDLAMGHGSTDTPAVNEVYVNDGGTLSASWQADPSDHTTYVTWIDIDGDGDLDLSVANFEDHDLVYENTTGEQPGDDDDSAGDDDDDDSAGDDDDDDSGDDDTSEAGDDDDSGSAEEADERLFLCECTTVGATASPWAALLGLALLCGALAARRGRGGRPGLLLLVAALAAGPAWAQDGVELDPEAEDAFFEGNGLLAEGQAAEALAAYDRALEIAPELYRVHLYRGRALLLLGELDAADDAARRFEAALSSDSERDEVEKLAAEIQAARAEVEPPPPPPTPERPRVHIGVAGGYAHSKRSLDNDWGLVQARLDVRLWSGLHARVQGGLGMAATDGALYGVVPIEVGATWRFSGPVVPFVDAHMLMVIYDDAKGPSGEVLGASPPGLGFGGGIGGGVEIPLGSSPLSIAPEFHIGWGGVLLVQGSLALRVGLGS